LAQFGGGFERGDHDIEERQQCADPAPRIRMAYAPDLPRMNPTDGFLGESVVILILPLGSQDSELGNRQNQDDDEQDHGHGGR
jgi:hypothetical protein